MYDKTMIQIFKTLPSVDEIGPGIILSPFSFFDIGWIDSANKGVKNEPNMNNPVDLTQ